MVRKKKDISKETLRLIWEKNDAEKKINERMEKGQEILMMPINSHETLEKVTKDYYKWDAYNNELLKKMFNTDEIADEYSAIFGFCAGAFDTIAQEVSDFHKDIKRKIHRLDSIKERLELLEERNMSKENKKVEKNEINKRKVFIVHGHDESEKQKMARFIEKLDLEAIILHEQTNQGKTIIEKLEKYSDVDYAVILLTPDDVGNVKSKKDELNLRARQNVILELGYFVGILGRKNVCAMYKTGVELPSDMQGIVYVSLDKNDGWKMKLAKELKEVGFAFDLNKVI